jgi:hypothetical protein
MIASGLECNQGSGRTARVGDAKADDDGREWDEELKLAALGTASFFDGSERSDQPSDPWLQPSGPSASRSVQVQLQRPLILLSTSQQAAASPSSCAASTSLFGYTYSASLASRRACSPVGYQDHTLRATSQGTPRPAPPPLFVAASKSPGRLLLSLLSPTRRAPGVANLLSSPSS